ncbi:hypothetical protein M5K25_020564 [Dendrobium thyrsiflorum]|uniref:RING-type E3 ubiquitin transferase n=1 Tax=Dendrobium thyrsiflorum TaxID=117978 RepID=A0ABD0UAX8_DENTH
MAENSFSSSIGGGSRMDIKINSLTIVVGAMFLFLTVIFVFLLYFYAKYYWGSRPNRRRAHFIFAAGNAPVPSRGLDPAVLSSIPITLYEPSDFKDGLECAVCLSELAAGEEVRLLPKCHHGFHLECIDMWFQSHSTCPICRCTVGPETVEDDGNRSAESPDIPTNVLFWGNLNQVSARRLASEEENSGASGSSERNLMISIPSRSTEGLFSSSVSPLPSSRSQIEEIKSPVEDKRSPATPKLWSLRRILSMGKKTSGSSSSSPRIDDIEQGLVGSAAENGKGSSSKSPTSSF